MIGAMEFKTGLILVIVLAIGCTALPTQQDDLSKFFDNNDSTRRVVGGTEAAEGSHPHMVALTHGLPVRHLLCGASLITTRTILTAAHCIDPMYSEGSLNRNLRATVGTNRWSTGGQTYAIERNFTHPHWLPSPIIKNDVGLLITATVVVLSKLVQPVPLSFDHVRGNVTVKAAGWGLTKAGGSQSPTLLELTTASVDGQQCVADVKRFLEENGWRGPAVEPHIELCAFIAKGQGVCHGDSGSALVRTDTHAQVGVVSWGMPCALGAPDMYARVSAFKEWIQKNTVK